MERKTQLYYQHMKTILGNYQLGKNTKFFIKYKRFHKLATLNNCLKRLNNSRR